MALRTVEMFESFQQQSVKNNNNNNPTVEMSNHVQFTERSYSLENECLMFENVTRRKETTETEPCTNRNDRTNWNETKETTKTSLKVTETNVWTNNTDTIALKVTRTKQQGAHQALESVMAVSQLVRTFYLPDCLPAYLSTYQPAYLPTYLPPSLPTCLPPPSLPTYQPACLPTYLLACLPAYRPTSLPTYMPPSLPPYPPTSLPT